MSESQTTPTPISITLEQRFDRLPDPGPNGVVLVNKGLMAAVSRPKPQREGRHSGLTPTGSPPRVQRNKPDPQRDPPTTSYALPHAAQSGGGAQVVLDPVKVQEPTTRDDARGTLDMLVTQKGWSPPQKDRLASLQRSFKPSKKQLPFEDEELPTAQLKKPRS